MSTKNRIRKNMGAAISLAIAVAFTLLVIGIGILYCTQTFSGFKQLTYATDAAALSGAKEIMTVTLNSSQVQQLPKEFQALGVDSNGNICPSGFDSNGDPALFNILSYNCCAVHCLVQAFNAAADNNSQEIATACSLINALNTYFALVLDQNIVSSSSISQAASNLMAANSVNNLPSHIFKNTAQPTVVPDSIKFGYYATFDPSGGVSFPASFYPNPNQTIDTWITQNHVLSQSLSNSGSPLVAAAKEFNIASITQNAQFAGLEVALVPIQRNERTHLVYTSPGYYFDTAFPGMVNRLPHNALLLAGETNGGNSGTASSGTASSGTTNSGEGNNATPVGQTNVGGNPASGSTSTNLNLIAMSAAVTNSPAELILPPPPARIPVAPFNFNSIHGLGLGYNGSTLKVKGNATTDPAGWSKLHTVTAVWNGPPITVVEPGHTYSIVPGEVFVFQTGDNELSVFKGFPITILVNSVTNYDPGAAAGLAQQAINAAEAKYGGQAPVETQAPKHVAY